MVLYVYFDLVRFSLEYVYLISPLEYGYYFFIFAADIPIFSKAAHICISPWIP
jgi:hypothetical protein